MFIAAIFGDGKKAQEYVVFETHVHDSLFIGIYGKGHVQRFRDSLSQNMSLMVSLDKEEQYSGLYMALKNPVDLSETSSRYLSFRIKGATGNENIYVSFKDTYKEKEKGDYDLQISRRIADMSKITDQWQEIHIPLDSFPVKGENWNRKPANGKLPITGPFDWSEVNSISFSKPDKSSYTFYLDDVKIVNKNEEVSKNED
ncbi:MAG: carbohydrate binding domain-containing protein [Cytophagaceae bacterium]